MGQSGLAASERSRPDPGGARREGLGWYSLRMTGVGIATSIVGGLLGPFVANDAAAVAFLVAAAFVVIGAVLALVSLRPLALLVSTAIIGAAIVVPGLLRACGCGGNEASAIGSLRAINSGQASYSSSCAAGGYAVDLADLVKAPSGSSQGFVSPDLSRNGVLKSEYIVTIARDAASGTTDVSSAASTCNGSGHQPASSYFASASPSKPGKSGTRWFASDTRGTIFFSATGPVPNPIPKDTPVVQ